MDALQTVTIEDASEEFAKTRRAPKQLQPLEIRFSQMKMRHLFGDGRRIAEVVPQVSVIRCSEEEVAAHGAPWKLRAPFPEIEVVLWRCKVRDDETGRPKVDPDTGEELFDTDERWFTLDNRRLYALQEAALTVWPERCVVDVSEMATGPHGRTQELRKFRTLDAGSSIKIGSKLDNIPFVVWSWRAKAGAEGASDGDEASRENGQLSSEVRREKGLHDGVLEHLASYKEDQVERIAISKKISFVLRRGAAACSIAMDGDGWVKVCELISDVLNNMDESDFFDVFAASNKQKLRYELSDDKEWIRATKREQGNATKVDDGVGARNGTKGKGRGKGKEKGNWKGAGREDGQAHSDKNNWQGKGKGKAHRGAGKGKASQTQPDVDRQIGQPGARSPLAGDHNAGKLIMDMVKAPQQLPSAPVMQQESVLDRSQHEQESAAAMQQAMAMQQLQAWQQVQAAQRMRAMQMQAQQMQYMQQMQQMQAMQAMQMQAMAWAPGPGYPSVSPAYANGAVGRGKGRRRGQN